jgi:hypothetical protein
VTCNGTVVVTPTAVGTSTYTITASGTGGSASASAAVTVNAVPVTVTSIAVTATPATITTAQTSQCAATVEGIGAFSTAVNWTATGGTITAAGAFTPTGVGTGSCVATSTQAGYTNISGSAAITVTAREITINSATGNNWLADCSDLFSYKATQTGIIAGGTLHVDPYTPDTFTAAPPSTFTITVGIGNTGSVNVCSPGAYSEYVTGTDGAKSNTHYVPIIDRWNSWAGYNATDEFQADFAGGVTDLALRTRIP